MTHLKNFLASWAVRQFLVSWNQTSNISMSFPSIKTTNKKKTIKKSSKFKVCCNKVKLVFEMHYSIWWYRPGGNTRKKLAKTWPTFNWSTQQVNYTLNICKSNTIYFVHFQFRFEFHWNCVAAALALKLLWVFFRALDVTLVACTSFLTLLLFN